MSQALKSSCHSEGALPWHRPPGQVYATEESRKVEPYRLNLPGDPHLHCVRRMCRLRLRMTSMDGQHIEHNSVGP